MNPDAAKVALGLALANPRSPLVYEQKSDEQLLAIVLARAPGLRREDGLEAIAKVRRLCRDVYQVVDDYRAGRFGEPPLSRGAALSVLSHRHPGFTAAQREAVFTAGLLWSAF